MGPTTVALLRLFRADKALREALERLDAVTRDVRLQETRYAQAVARLATAQTRLKDLQVKSANYDLDLKMRLEHIDKLRERQTQAVNNKEFQASLVEINSAKVDRAKIEEAAIKLLEQLEGAASDAKNYTTALESEESKLAEMKAKMGDKAIGAQAEVDRLRPDRDEAAKALTPAIVEQFDRLGDRYEGESMAAIERPSMREEEYLCTGCNMGLVPDVFNKLKTRNDIVTCPSCRRILYIPDTMTIENAVGKKSRSTKTGDKATRTIKKTITKTAATEPESKWTSLVAAAQGESARGAAEADHKPVECRVVINDEVVGVFKGKSAEHLDRVIRFRMAEANLSANVVVTPVEAAPAKPAVQEQLVAEQPKDAQSGPDAVQPEQSNGAEAQEGQLVSQQPNTRQPE